MEPEISRTCKEARVSLMDGVSNPAAIAKKLPDFKRVLAIKDVENFKKYGAMCEAYFYAGNLTAGSRLYEQLSGARGILAPNDTFVAEVACDIGLFYYTQKDFVTAKQYFLSSKDNCKNKLNSKNVNALVSSYICLALIADKEKKTGEAESYARQTMELIAKTKALRSLDGQKFSCPEI